MLNQQFSIPGNNIIYILRSYNLTSFISKYASENEITVHLSFSLNFNGNLGRKMSRRIGATSVVLLLPLCFFSAPMRQRGRKKKLKVIPFDLMWCYCQKLVVDYDTSISFSPSLFFHSLNVFVLPTSQLFFCVR